MRANQTMPPSDTAPAERLLPLDGVRVLDLSTMLAGPYCATVLGEFGAEVIKVELPGAGNTSRKFGTSTKSGSSFMWLSEQRNKKCITLDLRTPRGRDLALQLAARSDVIVENFMPGTLEKWGLGPDALEAVNEDIILVRVSAYGQTGPYIDRPGFARVAHGFAGLSHLAGEADGGPVIPGSTSLGDYITGLYAAIGALMSLLSRKRHGVGQVVDVGLYEGVFRMLDEIAPVYASTGFVRQRMGADTVNMVPHSHYAAADGRWVALACTNDAMWARMAAAMGRPELAQPDTYGQAKSRIADRAKINDIVAAFARTMDRDRLIEHCLRFEVPIGPIYDIAEIFDDPQYAARENLVKIRTAEDGEVTIPNVLPRLSRTPGRIDWLGQKLGESNREIYQGLLGLRDDELAALGAQGVI
jgi:crotonobetainyl-CoA:carnitine CoA-transferase CaiB-like acyl-CoA transferase